MGKEEYWMGPALFLIVLIAILGIGAFVLAPPHEPPPAPFEEWVGEEQVCVCGLTAEDHAIAERICGGPITATDTGQIVCAKYEDEP